MNYKDIDNEYLVKDFRLSRRNVMILNIIFILYALGGFEIEQLSILGNKIKVNNEVYLVIFGALMWAFSLLRFHQFYSRVNEASDQLFELQCRFYKPMLLKSMIENLPLNEQIKQTLTEHFEIEEIKYKGSSFEVSTQIEKDGLKGLTNVSNRGFSFGVRGQNASHYSIRLFKTLAPHLELRWRIKWLFYYIFKETYFFDVTYVYYFSVLAFASITYTIADRLELLNN